MGDTKILEIPASVFADEADRAYCEIMDSNSSKGAFSIENTEAFMRKIYVNKFKAPSADKSDICVELRDIFTGYEQIVGFSIKSQLGSPATLLNAGRTTNFIYRIDGIHKDKIAEINAIDTRHKILDRIAAIKSNGGRFTFIQPESKTFEDNLVMIDSQMPVIVAEMLIAYYSGMAKHCTELLNHVKSVNPLSRPQKFYEHKIKELLCSVALGMKPATAWDGLDEATGGYIIVKTDGEVLAYHIYNRDSFKSYLLHSTCFESAGTTRHEYAALYEESGETRIKLNLQIRFI